MQSEPGQSTHTEDIYGTNKIVLIHNIERAPDEASRQAAIASGLAHLNSLNVNRVWSDQDLELFRAVLKADKGHTLHISSLLQSLQGSAGRGGENLRHLVTNSSPILNAPLFSYMISDLSYGILADHDLVGKINSNPELLASEKSEAIKTCVNALIGIPAIATILNVKPAKLFASLLLGVADILNTDYAWKCIENSMNLARALSGREGLRDCPKTLLKNFGIYDFARYPFNMLERQYKNFADGNKFFDMPQALTLYPRVDHNGSFYHPLGRMLDEFYSIHGGDFQFQAFEYLDKISLYKIVQQRKKWNAPRTDLILFGAHAGELKEGEQKIQLVPGKRMEKKGEVRLQDIVYDERFEHLKSILAPNATIIIESCYLGVENGAAQKISRALACRVIASDRLNVGVESIFYFPNTSRPVAVNYWNETGRGTERGVEYINGERV